MDEEKIISVLSEGVHIPPELCEFTPQAFDGIWMEYVKSGEKHEYAYELTEKGHEKIFGHRKYSSYDSFRISRSNRLNK